MADARYDTIRYQQKHKESIREADREPLQNLLNLRVNDKLSIINSLEGLPSLPLCVFLSPSSR